MPIRTDETGRRWVEMEILVPGTPEEVWRAMATGPGNTAWFIRSEIEPRIGGGLTFDFGEGALSSGEVTMWEPPYRFAYIERDWSPGAPPVATEITIAGRPGEQCVVRMVHSLFSSVDDWNDEVEGFQSGWPGFFEVLRLYLGRFAGLEAASFMKMTPASGSPLDVWKRLGDALGLSGADVGERRMASSSGPERWSAIVEHLHQDARQRWWLLRVEDPSPGIALIGTYDKGATSHEAADANTTNVSVCRYFYGDNVAARIADAEAGWEKFLASTFGERDTAVPES